MVQQVISQGIQLMINLDIDLWHRKQSLVEVEIALLNEYTTRWPNRQGSCLTPCILWSTAAGIWKSNYSWNWFRLLAFLIEQRKHWTRKIRHSVQPWTSIMELHGSQWSWWWIVDCRSSIASRVMVKCYGISWRRNTSWR